MRRLFTLGSVIFHGIVIVAAFVAQLVAVGPLPVPHRPLIFERAIAEIQPVRFRRRDVQVAARDDDGGVLDRVRQMRVALLVQELEEALARIAGGDRNRRGLRRQRVGAGVLRLRRPGRGLKAPQRDAVVTDGQLGQGGLVRGSGVRVQDVDLHVFREDPERNLYGPGRSGLSSS